MFKKITTLLLLTAFTNVYALSPVQQSRAIAEELNKTFDSLNYKLNVEWNQKDSQFFDATISDFEREISSLQKEGVSNNDLIKYTTDRIKDKEIKKEIDSLSKAVTENQMSDEEARAFVVSKLSSTYSHGASWSGSRMGGHTAVLVGLIVLILICCNKDKTKTPDPKKDPKHPKDDCRDQMTDWSQSYDFRSNSNEGGPTYGCYPSIG